MGLCFYRTESYLKKKKISKYIGNQDLENHLCHDIIRKNCLSHFLEVGRRTRCIQFLPPSNTQVMFSLVRTLCIEDFTKNLDRYAFLSTNHRMYSMITPYIEIQI